MTGSPGGLRKWNMQSKLWARKIILTAFGMYQTFRDIKQYLRPWEIYFISLDLKKYFKYYIICDIFQALGPLPWFLLLCFRRSCSWVIWLILISSNPIISFSLAQFSQYRNDSDIYSGWIEMYDSIKLIISKKEKTSVILFK